MKSSNLWILIAITLAAAAFYFGNSTYNTAVTGDSYPTAVEIGGFSITTLGAILASIVAAFKNIFPGKDDNGTAKIVQIVELVINLIANSETWELIKKKFKSDGFPVYISLKVGWKDKTVYPIEIGKDPALP